MKSENTVVKIGDVVKSLDFVGVSDCYLVGFVTDILSDGTFRANTIKRVFEGRALPRSSEWFVAPLPGNHFFDDLAETKGREPRIQVLA
jgi:hypothetical protein